MSWLDWLVLLLTLATIVGYGIWKTRQSSTMESYLRGNNENRWWEIGLSVMATQASAITFLSTPGQAFDDGMRFVQFYLGLPLAMIVVSAFFIPVYYRLKVFTAYEFLESRFDLKTRTFTAALFLIQRGLAAGITIYAPSIIISKLLGVDLNSTILFIGVLVTIYVLTGGTRAVSVTHKQQMTIIFLGMFIAFGFLVYYMQEAGGLGNAVKIAGAMGKMNIIDTNWDIDNRYTLWSGLLGGFFLQLSYFGCDQSQVARYLGGRNTGQSRLGLMMNGIIKIPMQFFILFTGVLVFMFYQFHTPPMYFNDVEYEEVRQSAYANEVGLAEEEYNTLLAEKELLLDKVVTELESSGELSQASREALAVTAESESAIKAKIDELVHTYNPDAGNEVDYVFMTFVLDYLPIGLIGLLFAVIFSASMSSTSSEINALAGTFAIDIYRRLLRKEASDRHYVIASRLFTLLFGVLAITFAMVASLFDNLIEAVNIIGSLFYGTILGIFLTAFLLKKIRGNAVFFAAVITQLLVFYVDFTNRYDWPFPAPEVSYLWYNAGACILVMGIAGLLQMATLNTGRGK